MSAPINDNFANAIPLTLGFGGVGQIYGTNIGATFEAGEPATNGSSSVWYSIVLNGLAPPAQNTGADLYFQTTNFTGSNGFRTFLQAFSGSAGSASLGVHDLTEVGYFNAASSTISYGGWDQGSKIGFFAPSGSTIYIRVDSIKSGSQYQGDFNLSFGGYHNTTLNSCSLCPPFLADGIECVGQVFLANSGFVSPTIMSYGTIDTGSYVWKYCKGCVCYGDGTLSQGNLAWSVYLMDPPPLSAGAGPSFWIHYQSGSAEVSASLGNLPAFSGSFPSQTTCEDAFQCAQTSIVHSGGLIYVSYEDAPTSDNTVVANPPPSFGLYLVKPNLAAGIACATWQTVGSTVSCVFTVDNLNAGYWGQVSASVVGGGITGSTTALFDILPNANSPVTLNFSCSNYGQNVVLKLDSDQFDSTIQLPYFLNPLISASFINEGFAGTCNGKRQDFISMDFFNTGNWTISDAALSGSLTNGVEFLTEPFVTACNAIPTIVISPDGQDSCNGGSFITSTALFRIRAPSVSTATTLSASYVTNHQVLRSFVFNTVVTP